MLVTMPKILIADVAGWINANHIHFKLGFAHAVAAFSAHATAHPLAGCSRIAEAATNQFFNEYEGCFMSCSSPRIRFFVEGKNPPSFINE